MAAGTDGQARRHRVGNPEQPDHRGSQDGAQNPGDNHRHHGNGGQSSGGFHNPHGNGCGHRLGNQGDGELLIQSQQSAQGIHAEHGGCRTRHCPHQNGQPILLQHRQFGVNPHRKTSGSRCQEQADDLSAGVVVLIGNPEHQQHPHHQHNGNQKGVAKGRPKFPVQPAAQRISGNAEENSKIGGSQQFSHCFFLLFISRTVSCTLQAVTAKVITVLTRHTIRIFTPLLCRMSK